MGTVNKSTGVGHIRLYDIKSLTAGPFTTFEIPPSPTAPHDNTQYHHHQQHQPDWVSMRFSNDGKLILISTVGDLLVVVDAFEGEVLLRLTGRINNAMMGLEGTFTPDAKFIAAGKLNLYIYRYYLLYV